MYSGYEITLDNTGSRSFDNDAARNVIIFAVHNSSSSHAEIPRIIFQCEVKVQLLELMETLVHQRKYLD